MTDLEERIAYLERRLDDVSDMVAQHDQTIAKLSHLVDALIAREADREAQQSGGVILGDERPPHY